MKRTSSFFKRSSLIALLLGAGAFGGGLVTAADTESTLLERAKQLFRPQPYTAHVDDYPHSAARVELGKKLFFETRHSFESFVQISVQPDLEGPILKNGGWGYGGVQPPGILMGMRYASSRTFKSIRMS